MNTRKDLLDKQSRISEFHTAKSVPVDTKLNHLQNDVMQLEAHLKGLIKQQNDGSGVSCANLEI